MHLEKEKKEKPVSYKTKRTEVIRSRNAHNSENSAKVCWKFKWDDKRGSWKEMILMKIAIPFSQICQFHQMICPFPRTKPVQMLEHLNDTWSDLYVHCMYMYCYLCRACKALLKTTWNYKTYHNLKLHSILSKN